MHFHRIGHKRIEVKLNLVRIGLGRGPQALCKPSYVGIHADRRLVKGISPQDIGGFSTHARQGHQILESLWNFAIEPIGTAGLSTIRSVIGGLFLASVTMLLLGLFGGQTIGFVAVADLGGFGQLVSCQGKASLVDGST